MGKLPEIGVHALMKHHGSLFGGDVGDLLFDVGPVWRLVRGHRAKCVSPRQVGGGNAALASPPMRLDGWCEAWGGVPLGSVSATHPTHRSRAADDGIHQDQRVAAMLKIALVGAASNAYRPSSRSFRVAVINGRSQVE